MINVNRLTREEARAIVIAIKAKMSKYSRMARKVFYKAFPFDIKIGQNGRKYVPINSVRNDVLNLSTNGNSKTGKVIAFNLPVELTCRHDCECYYKKMCYALNGCYCFASNQSIYSENLAFFKTHTSEQFISYMVALIIASGKTLFRWFTCGDIPNYRFLECMIEIARRCGNVTFWTYTKKYKIVNKWLRNNGGINSLPSNFQSIIFSHWMNEDGSYLPMENTYNMPTSEFIPFGREDLLKTVNHVCPCSDPDIFTTCETCPTPCYQLKPGQRMALCEHSTARTKERDKYLKAMKEKALKDGNYKYIEALEKASKLAKGN